MFSRVSLALSFALMLGVVAFVGCGGAASTSTAPEGHTGQIEGHSGGMHALGANPEAETARLKKAGASQKAGPQRLPGR